MTAVHVKKGDSYAYGAKIQGITDLTGYTCQMQVRAKDNPDVALVDKSIDAVGDKFHVNLAPDESSTLEIGKTYTMAAQISNASLEYAREVEREIEIVKEYVY
jgi:hypothetical protein